MTVTTSTTEWSMLRRKSPDASAPSTPSPRVLAVYDLIAKCAFYLSLPVIFPYFTLKHYTLGPPAPWMSLKVHLLTRMFKTYLYRYVFYLPGVDPQEGEVPSQYANGRRGVAVTKVTVPGVDASLRQGFAECDAIETVPRPAFMLTPPGASPTGIEPARPGEKVVFYLVGGAYAFGHPLRLPFAWNMSSEFGVRVFAVNYRKALTATSAHPAPMLDALAGWIYLTETLGFDPRKVTFVGESAGGHLCLMLSRYLADIGLPLPGAVALSGPWADLTTSFPSLTRNYDADYLPWLGSLSAASLMRYYLPEATRGPYFSPALASPADWAYLVDNKVVVYIHVGTIEIIVDEVTALVEGMRGANVNVTLIKEVGGLHQSATMNFKGSNGWTVFRDHVKTIILGTDEAPKD